MPSQRFRRSWRRTLEFVIRRVTRWLGRPPNVDPLVRIIGLRVFFRRYYGAFIDAHGASFADVDETIGRMRSLKPDAWASAWRSRAEHYEQLGRTAAANDRSASASELLRRASTFYRIAEIALLDDSDTREKLQRACLETFRQAGRYMEPPVERVSIPVSGGRTTIGYLRVPRVHQPPVVVLMPGLGMVKEHGDFPPDPLIERGIATLSIDLPGQGENRGVFPLDRENAQLLFESALDYVDRRDELDSRRVGLLGTSMGAAAAMFTAASDRRVKAIAEIAGFYQPARWWNHFLAGSIKEFMRYIVGARDEAELFQLVKSVNLAGHVARIECPILVIHGEQDDIVPVAEGRRIFAEARQPKEQLFFPTGDHGCVNVAEVRPLVADWLADVLHASMPRD